MRRIARVTLQKYGYRVLTADNGQAAVQLFESIIREIELVILDLTMPVMGGEAALQQLKCIDPAAKILLSSGFSSAEVAERFRGRGLAGFLQKPYAAAKLAEEVQTALGRNGRAQASKGAGLGPIHCHLAARQEAANANRRGRQTEEDFGAADQKGPPKKGFCAARRRVDRPPRKEKPRPRERQQKHHAAASICKSIEQRMRHHASRPYQPQPEKDLAGMATRDNSCQSGGQQDQKKR
jgi:CheY-like chemotaxis protein